MNPTALPSTALQGDLDSGFQAFVGVRDDQGNPVETPVSQTPQKLGPERFCFTVTNINTEYFGCLLSLWAHQPLAY